MAYMGCMRVIWGLGAGRGLKFQLLLCLHFFVLYLLVTCTFIGNHLYILYTSRSHMNLYPCFAHLFSDLGEIQYKGPTHFKLL
jgi:hypothetical protein